MQGYYVDTVEKNKTAIEKYIKNQLQDDIVGDEINMKEYMDAFTGEKSKK